MCVSSYKNQCKKLVYAHSSLILTDKLIETVDFSCGTPIIFNIGHKSTHWDCYHHKHGRKNPAMLVWNCPGFCCVLIYKANGNVKLIIPSNYYIKSIPKRAKIYIVQNVSPSKMCV